MENGKLNVFEAADSAFKTIIGCWKYFLALFLAVTAIEADPFEEII